jgi:hypothetical protein
MKRGIMAESMARPAVAGAEGDWQQARAARRPLLMPVVATFLLTMIVLALRALSSGSDYVGFDNDDTMRLVQVRDLLAGQPWFDLTQYRLGLDGGTAMHWSRLVDLPIANLIAVFSAFLESSQAEALALAVWPAAMMLAMLSGVALASWRLGGAHTVFGGLLLAALFAISSNRFSPGAIDHHNVQLALVILAAAAVLDPRMRKSSFLLAGTVSALAIAIGAETAPLVGAISATVAILWAWRGEAARAAAEGFGIAFAASLALAFYATVPPDDYGVAVCDAFSGSFYWLGTIGGAAVFLAASRFSDRPRAQRLAVLAIIGALIAVSTVAIAPQCLAAPLSELDPMLRELWLAHVTEAKSAFALASSEPISLTAHYLVPLIALGLCARRIAGRRMAVEHSMLAFWMVVAFIIALVQVRGAVFANLLAIPVLAVAIGDARQTLRERPKGKRAVAMFLILPIVLSQMTWIIVASLLEPAEAATPGQVAVVADASRHARRDAELRHACRHPAQMAALGAEERGVVSAVSNIGDDILRHTRHRVLSAPYHRNQGGMLTQLHIAAAAPGEARAFLEGAGVTLVVLCPGDPETRMMARRYPEGLYAELLAGRRPGYLRLQTVIDGMAIYALKPAVGTN